MAEIHLDRDVLSALQEVMEGEFGALLETFISDSHQRLQQLHKASDRRQLVATAHSFKGSSSNMGAVHLAALCHRLEQSAAELAPQDVDALVAQIDREFAIVSQLYRQEADAFRG